MLNDILHKNNLGAYQGRSGTSSTSTTSRTNTSTTSSTNTSTTSSTGDPYAQYITYQNGVPVVIVSDGTYSVALVLEELTSRGEKKYTVPEALNNFFRVYWTYDKFMKITRDKNNTVHATAPRSDVSVWHEGDDKKKYAEIALQDQMDTETRNNAISTGNAITLGDLLKSVKNKIVYVRAGYVYIGNSLEPAPKASTGDAASATDFLNDKGTGSSDGNTITVGNDDDDDIWWLLLPVVVGGAYLLTRKGKKKKKRK